MNSCLALFLFLPSINSFYFAPLHEPEDNNLYASIHHMEPTVKLEKLVASVARDYLEEQKKALFKHKPLKDSIEEGINLSKQGSARYIGNPVNSYYIVRRLTQQWKHLAKLQKVDDSKLEYLEELLEEYKGSTPSEKIDIGGASQGLMRLMDVHGYTARDLAAGEIPGVKPSLLQLSASDALDIAEVAHDSLLYVHMKEWLKESERLLSEPNLSNRHGNITMRDILEYLVWSSYMENDIASAMKYANLILRVEPQNKKFLVDSEFYAWHLQNNIPVTFPETTYMEAAQVIRDDFYKTSYYKACSTTDSTYTNTIGFKDINKSRRSFYYQGSPLLYLKPLKVTQMHDNPEVFILHDVLTDKQIEEIKDIATPRLRLARIMDPVTNTFIVASYRVSKSMFFDTILYPEDLELSNRLDKHFEAVTGLRMKHAEAIQINNYGIGGQYEFHHDYGVPNTVLYDDPNGNRIATLLLYLSDVEKGGETVFTELGLAVPPEKGSALFWYNLHRNGTGFYDTKHASCPVVSGSKWVANKWIKLGGNEFRRPCSLNQFE